MNWQLGADLVHRGVHAPGDGQRVGPRGLGDADEDRRFALVPGRGLVVLRPQLDACNVAQAHQRGIVLTHHQFAEVLDIGDVGGRDQVDQRVLAACLTDPGQVVVRAQHIGDGLGSHAERRHPARVEPDAHREGLVADQLGLGHPRYGLQFRLYDAQQVVVDLRCAHHLAVEGQIHQRGRIAGLRRDYWVFRLLGQHGAPAGDLGLDLGQRLIGWVVQLHVGLDHRLALAARRRQVVDTLRLGDRLLQRGRDEALDQFAAGARIGGRDRHHGVARLGVLAYLERADRTQPDDQDQQADDAGQDRPADVDIGKRHPCGDRSQFVVPGADHPLTGRQAAGHGDPPGLRAPGLDLAAADGTAPVLVFDHEDRIAVGGIADRSIRNRQNIFFLRQLDLNVGKHAGSEQLFRICELGPDAETPAADLDARVDRDDLAGEPLARPGLYADLDHLPFADPGQLALGQREIGVDRVERLQRHDRRARAQVLAEIDAPDAEAAVERCADALLVEQRLLRGDLGLRVIECGTGLVEIGLGDRFLAHQLGDTVELDLCQRTFGQKTLKGGLVGVVVEFEQQFPCPDRIAGGEMDRVDLAADLGRDLDTGDRREAADRLQMGLPGLGLDGRCGDHGRRRTAATCRGHLRGHMLFPAEDAPEYGGEENHDQNDADSHQDPCLLRCRASATSVGPVSRAGRALRRGHDNENPSVYANVTDSGHDGRVISRPGEDQLSTTWRRGR